MKRSRVLLTEERILEIAEEGRFVVHRFRWSHEKLRKQTRRMLKEGKLALASRNQTQFVYTTPRNVREEAAGREFALVADLRCPEDF